MKARTLYLRAADAAAMDAALVRAGVAQLLDDELLAGPMLLPAPGVTLQIIGVVAEDATGDEPAPLLPGWHAMLLDVGLSDAQRAALEPLVIARPDVSGVPVFAGVEEPATAADVPAAVPASCTRRQGRLALLQLAHLDAVEQAIAAIADADQRRAAQIEYEADTWERSNAFLQAMWAQLGGAPGDLDALFRLAVTL